MIHAVDKGHDNLVAQIQKIIAAKSTLQIDSLVSWTVFGATSFGATKLNGAIKVEWGGVSLLGCIFRIFRTLEMLSIDNVNLQIETFLIFN